MRYHDIRVSTFYWIFPFWIRLSSILVSFSFPVMSHLRFVDQVFHVQSNPLFFRSTMDMSELSPWIPELEDKSYTFVMSYGGCDDVGIISGVNFTSLASCEMYDGLMKTSINAAMPGGYAAVKEALPKCKCTARATIIFPRLLQRKATVKVIPQCDDVIGLISSQITEQIIPQVL